jgi:tRNA A37 threonylcarbamoyladenosine dehydratase
MDRFERCKMLFGEEDFNKIQKAKIIILGVGGVGGHALDCLYRSGVKDITIVDFDRYDITNQNRQIGSDELDTIKVDRLSTLYPGIKTMNAKIDLEWIKEKPLDGYDLILDAIDDIPPKVAIIQRYYKKLISSGGSAKRIDPTKIEYINIWKTHNDPFLRKIRENLKKNGFRKNFKIIFSGENPQCTTKGSFVGVTGSFGLTMCSITINKILSQE